MQFSMQICCTSLKIQLSVLYYNSWYQWYPLEVHTTFLQHDLLQECLQCYKTRLPCKKSFDSYLMNFSLYKQLCKKLVWAKRSKMLGMQNFFPIMQNFLHEAAKTTFCSLGNPGFGGAVQHRHYFITTDNINCIFALQGLFLLFFLFNFGLVSGCLQALFGLQSKKGYSGVRLSFYTYYISPIEIGLL